MNDTFAKRRRFTLEDTDWSGQVMGFGTSMSGDPCFVGGTFLRPLLRVANLKSENQPCLTIAAYVFQTAEEVEVLLGHVARGADSLIFFKVL